MEEKSIVNKQRKADPTYQLVTVPRDIKTAPVKDLDDVREDNPIFCARASRGRGNTALRQNLDRIVGERGQLSK